MVNRFWYKRIGVIWLLFIKQRRSKYENAVYDLFVSVLVHYSYFYAGSNSFQYKKRSFIKSPLRHIFWCWHYTTSDLWTLSFESDYFPDYRRIAPTNLRLRS